MEIDLISASLSGRRVIEIHWGGGTPNILSADQFERVVSRLAQRGMVQLDGDQLRLTQDARPFCRLVAAAFDAYVHAGAARHSRAV